MEGQKDVSTLIHRIFPANAGGPLKPIMTITAIIILIIIKIMIIVMAIKLVIAAIKNWNSLFSNNCHYHNHPQLFSDWKC